jgi:hypothetical protein
VGLAVNAAGGEWWSHIKETRREFKGKLRRARVRRFRGRIHRTGLVGVDLDCSHPKRVASRHRLRDLIGQQHIAGG